MLVEINKTVCYEQQIVVPIFLCPDEVRATYSKNPSYYNLEKSGLYRALVLLSLFHGFLIITAFLF
jgi:hypothetical protein